MGVTKIVSSKIFLVVISLIIGGVIGWFAWYLVYPNLHVSGSQVWTGSVAPATGKAPTTGYSSGSSSVNTKSSGSSYSTTPSSTPSSSTTPSSTPSSSSSSSYSY
ncbi:MAG: hypothetical protein ACYDBX_00560 [Patescibacteria group bacterium]